MDEINNLVKPQAGNANNLQPQAGAITPTEPQAGEGNEPISLEKAKELRAEAANLRKRLKAFEDAEAKAKDAQLTETERLNKQLADLQAKHDTATKAAQDRQVSYEVRLLANQMGFHDANVAYTLIDKPQLKYDDNGTPTNVNDLLTALAKSQPYLIGKQVAATSGGATNPSRSASSATLSWDSIAKMTPEQYNARRSEIQQFIRDNPNRRF